MIQSAFNRIFKRRNQLSEETLASKNVEYARGNDKLYNFKRAAQVLNTIPEKALLGMFVKHLVSVMDMVDDIEAGKLPSDELIDEKLGDMINYTHLLEALISERKGNK